MMTHTSHVDNEKAENCSSNCKKNNLLCNSFNYMLAAHACEIPFDKHWAHERRSRQKWQTPSLKQLQTPWTEEKHNFSVINQQSLALIKNLIANAPVFNSFSSSHVVNELKFRPGWNISFPSTSKNIFFIFAFVSTTHSKRCWWLSRFLVAEKNF